MRKRCRRSASSWNSSVVEGFARRSVAQNFGQPMNRGANLVHGVRIGGVCGDAEAVKLLYGLGTIQTFGDQNHVWT